MNALSIETNIDSMKDCLFILTVLVKKFADNGMIMLTDEEVNGMENTNRLIMSVDPATDKLVITHYEYEEGTLQ